MPTAEELAKQIGGLGSSVGGAVGSIWGPVGGMAGSVLGSVGGGLVSAIPALIKSDYEKDNAKRLELLKRRQELGALGFTEEEKQAMYNAGSSATDKAAADVQALQSTTAAALSTGAGMAAAKQVAQQEPVIAARAALERDIQAKNLEEVRLQEQELEERSAIASEAKARKQAAVVGLGTTALASMDEVLEQAKTVRGSKPSSEQLKSFSKLTGLTPEEAGPALEFMARATPEQQQLFKGLLNPSGKGVVR